ncbi:MULTISPECIES: MFS transporter [Metallosphaera]|uniref:Major facilitator superfamily MFS_1 n=3 Tax=Metallosphaera TaxID=41980 RepID=A4YDZ2_METS5|nr:MULTISPECIES: MFS transporter [Metallosphaera]ABP94644.1 major facilitator superfamily MFS_1 [Metallosphaera sedula DSM 5348]AIM26631.1 major facilitator superfamily MFS_1 [Metallosphaera sedula]AKV73610.1 hypothetical protein MsedA_0481 [Metallosphaera sedula]AKV75851.1 hypothetical protein MsedB_0481 [Metallosphaera sedula]AKV78100.1 hypothetical protein MsedC_0480 [Metallosphaera sedula]
MKRTLLALAMGGYTDGFDLLIIAGVLGEVLKVFKPTRLETGLLVSTSFLGSIVGAIILGLVCDIMGRRKSYLISLILFIIGALISATAQDYGSLVLGRLLVGLGIGGEIPSSTTLLTEISKKWVGLIFASWAIGALSATIIPFFVYPWRIALLLGAVPPLIAVALHRWIRESEVWLNSSRINNASKFTVNKASSIATLVTGLSQLVLTMVLASFAVYVPGYSMGTQLINWTLFAIGSVLTISALRRKHILFLSYLLIGVFLVTYSVTGLFSAIALVWFFSCLAFGFSFLYVGELRSATDRGTFNGFLFFMGRLGGAIGTFSYPLLRYELKEVLLMISLSLMVLSLIIPFLEETRIEKVE